MSLAGRRARAVAGGVMSILLTSCAGTQDAEASTVARGLLMAVAEHDGERACTLLAPPARAELEESSGNACNEAVLEEDLGEATSPVTVEVYDSMAVVRFESATVFLSRFDGDWRVVGAGCTPNPGDQPYDCSVQVS